MSDAEYQAMAETANSLGLDYSGHVTAETGLLESARLGQGTIDHLDGVILELAYTVWHSKKPVKRFFWKCTGK